MDLKPPQRPLLLPPAVVAYLGHYLERVNKTLATHAHTKLNEMKSPTPAAQSYTASAPHPS
jgi:hypothetical protein